MKLSNGIGIVAGLFICLSLCGASAAVAPAFTSAPMAAGAPLVGNTIVICAAAVDPQGLPLTFTYNYGDGTSDTLGKHVYTATGIYVVTVTASNGSAITTASLSISIMESANLWIKKQSIKAGAAGKRSWQAQYIYNADRTQAQIFNPATGDFMISLGTIPAIQITSSGNGAQKFSGSKPKLIFKSAKGAIPSISVVLDESNQTLTINAKSETFADKAPGIFHNSVQLGTSSFFIDQALDAKGIFTANSGYRSTAFVVATAGIKVGKAGKDSALISMLLGDPAFAFPGASGAKTLHVRVTNVLNKIVIDKDLTTVAIFKAGKLKSGKDTTTPTGAFTYDSLKGKMSFKLSKATLNGLLATSEEHVRVDVTLGDRTYTTHVTLFAAKAGTYSTKLPKKFAHFIPANVVDTLVPTVVSTTPLNLSLLVTLGTGINATFSEAMNPATLNSTTFTLLQGSTAVPGAVSYTGNIAVFTPSTLLSAGAQFTAVISTGATDLAGNPLVCNYVWTFTTVGSPTVTSTVPANTASGVAINSKMSVTFSEAMDPSTLNTGTFTVNQGSTPVTGTVTYAAAGNTATFAPASSLASNTVYTATVTTGAKDTSGIALASNFVWIFTTGTINDTTPPTVTSTIPVNLATGVAINSKISAAFSEAMDPSSLNSATFTVMQGASPVPGTVTYSAAGGATFTPSSNFATSTLFSATVTTGATDLAGNALANNFTWSFTTGAAPDTTPPNVVATNPVDMATGIALNQSVNATFDKAMDPASINTANFTLAAPGRVLITGTIAYDATSKIATFTPGNNLAANTQYSATVTTGVKDLAGNALAINKIWTFTTSTQTAVMPVALGAIQPFGTFGGGAGMTNQGISTVVNGDIGTTGASTTVTGFHDKNGDIYTETPLNVGKVNGTINTAPPTPGGAGVGGNASTFAIATQAASDANTAYNNLLPASIPGGTDPGAGQLGGLTLPPGVYKSAGATFQITGSDLTLDAKGDSNAVFIFQMAASLTVGGPGAPRSVILINGAQAKNVFWQVGSSATINAAGGGTMVGTIIASSGVTFSTAGNVTLTTLNGRAIGLNASTTLVNTIINVPAP